MVVLLPLRFDAKERASSMMLAGASQPSPYKKVGAFHLSEPVKAEPAVASLLKLDSTMPPSWASQWARRADKVTSTRFYWVGQGGVQTPSDDARVQERLATASYAPEARQRLTCVAAMRTRANFAYKEFCRGSAACHPHGPSPRTCCHPCTRT